MKQKLVVTVASVALAAVGVTGFAFAQDNPNQEPNRPGNERMEKGNRTEGGAQHKMNNAVGERQEATPEGQPRTSGELPRKAQNGAEPKSGGAQTGQATQPTKPEGETRTGQGARPEKREGEPRTGQATQPIKPEGETRTGQRARTQKPEGATAQSGREDNRMRNVRVSGNLHVSDENASRITETLMGRGRGENINVNVHVGARLPEDVRPMPLPPEVVELAPEYRGYDYVVDNDEIIFVEPTTRRVVGMIDTGGATAQEETGQQIARAKPCPVD